MAIKARILKKFQVTIPLQVREKFDLEEGEYVNVEATPKGILITRAREIDADQAWFWSPRWMAGERAADADFAAGRYTVHDDADAAIRQLRTKPPRITKKK